MSDEAYQSDTNQHTLLEHRMGNSMTDSLRDRIAAVHLAHAWGIYRLPDGYAYSCCRCHWRRKPDGPAHSEHVADAVIAALEVEYALVPKNYTVKKAVTGRMACNPHPDAPHGFDRNGSLNEDRYVCECESWSPLDDDPYEAKADEERQQWADDEGIPND